MFSVSESQTVWKGGMMHSVLIELESAIEACTTFSVKAPHYLALIYLNLLKFTLRQWQTNDEEKNEYQDEKMQTTLTTEFSEYVLMHMIV